MIKEKISTPTKHKSNNIHIVSATCTVRISEKIDVDPPISTKPHNLKKATTNTVKRTITPVDPHATHLDVDSLPTFKK